MRVREHACVVAACMCMPEDNLQELILSFRFSVLRIRLNPSGLVTNTFIQ